MPRLDPDFSSVPYTTLRVANLRSTLGKDVHEADGSAQGLLKASPHKWSVPKALSDDVILITASWRPIITY